MASELWQRLRAARKAANITQEELGLKIGVTRAAVSQWEHPVESKRSRPRWEHITAVCAVTGAPRDWMMNDESTLESFWFQDEHIQVPSDSDSKDWQGYVPVRSIETGSEYLGKETLADADMSFIAIKGAWASYHGVSPKTLVALTVRDALSVGVGIARGDVLLVNIAETKINSVGLWVVGKQMQPVRASMDFNGKITLVGDDFSIPADDSIPVFGRVILHVRSFML
jgi:transcriptional regulator with XRE-family HTH domain